MEELKGKRRNNPFISNLNKKDVNHFTSDIGLFLRRKCDVPYKLVAHELCGIHVIKPTTPSVLSDEEYFANLSEDKIPLSYYPLEEKKHNVIVERYPKLNKDEPYIFVCNHTCPEDIETILNVLDRNAYLVLGSVKTLREEADGYLVWLNGTIPFDISKEEERASVIPKADRVLKTNSILIFPEASHNLDPNKLVNHLFDGPVNMALNTNRKIVLVSLVRDINQNVSFVDVSNPIDINALNEELDKKYQTLKENLSVQEYTKKKIKTITAQLRDGMASGVMNILLRHDQPLERKKYKDIEAYLRTLKVRDSFEKLHWNENDDFAGEFQTKKNPQEEEYKRVVEDIAALALSGKEVGFDQSGWVELAKDLENKNIPHVMEEHAKQLKKLKVNK